MSKEHTLKVISAVIVNHRRREVGEIIKIDDDQLKRLGGKDKFQDRLINGNIKSVNIAHFTSKFPDTDVTWAKKHGLYSVNDPIPNVPDQDPDKIKKPGESNPLPAWAQGEKNARLKNVKKAEKLTKTEEKAAKKAKDDAAKKEATTEDVTPTDAQDPEKVTGEEVVDETPGEDAAGEENIDDLVEEGKKEEAKK